jgi:hypothetical protein
MKTLKITEKNKIVLEKILTMVPSIVKIVEDVMSDAKTYENMLTAYVEEAIVFQERVDYLEMENRKLKEEIKTLKTIH